ncbi:histidine acid phosphatase [Myriangium duriaei CBS 260.36]|uniref:Phytase A n=1 Tax=Myriangium duriaei CBS 260.36 TaxID=1168546 RepID=A0A9P4IWE2_9PEZI|nr:histidine acid phosphatase [Myriangium duriaei CBS 260.36]
MILQYAILLLLCFALAYGQPADLVTQVAQNTSFIDPQEAQVPPTDPQAKPSLPCDTINFGYQCQSKISHKWGTNSPYFSAPSKLSPSLPSGCTITFVNALYRHGARFPTKKHTPFYASTIAYIQRSVKPAKLTGKYAFLKKYKFALGIGDLTGFGQQQMVNAGVQFYRRYSPLAKKEDVFFRSAGMERVALSAKKFGEGFHAEKKLYSPDRSWPYPMLLIPEGPTSNSTLSHDVCPAFEKSPKPGGAEKKKWAAVFLPPIARRLAKDLGVDFSVDQTLALMDMCPFATVSDARGRVSDFCALFTPAEWSSYSHYSTLTKWHNFGPGNPLGPTQGVGYTNELIARLTGRPVVDRTSTNRTLTGSKVTFPLDRKLYVDATHNNDMVSILFAMNLFDEGAPTPHGKGAWDFKADTAVPFASRIVVEKMVCGKKKGPELVRVLVNDRVMPLRHCSADKLGRCEVGKYVESLAFARGMGRWDKC